MSSTRVHPDRVEEQLRDDIKAIQAQLDHLLAPADVSGSFSSKLEAMRAAMKAELVNELRAELGVITPLAGAPSQACSPVAAPTVAGRGSNPAEAGTGAGPPPLSFMSPAAPPLGEPPDS